MAWLDRQSFLGVDSDAILAATSVAIVGLGGGGSHVVQQLAHIGIGNFVIVDDDLISETNLNRLVGATYNDVICESPKVAIAERVIRAINPAARVSLRQSRWQEVAHDLRDCDAIFGCVDNVRSKDELEAFCRRFLIPYIDQGMNVHVVNGGFLVSGQVMLSMPGQPCLKCYGVVTQDALDEEARNYGAAGAKPQVVWPNGVLASTAVGLLIQLITTWHAPPIASACLEYDGNRHTVTPSDRAAMLERRTCPHYDQRDLSDPMFDIRVVLAAPAMTVEAAPADPRPSRGIWGWIMRLIGRL